MRWIREVVFHHSLRCTLTIKDGDLNGEEVQGARGVLRLTCDGLEVWP
jgi:hypothetical protein